MSSADQEKVKRRRFEPKVWDTLRRVYEALGLAFSLQKVLEISAVALGYDLDDMPTIKGVESRIMRERWVAGIKKIELDDGREKQDNQHLDDSGQNNDFEGKIRKDGDIQSVIDEIDQKYQQKIHDNSSKFHDEIKSDQLNDDQKIFLIDFVDEFLQDRKEIMARHKVDFKGYAKEIKIATDFALHPIDLSGDEMEFRKSRAIAELGRSRLGLIATSIQAMTMLQVREQEIYGFDYALPEEIEPNAAKKEDESKRLVEVRGDIHAYYKQESERFAKERQELQGRGELVANELSGVMLDETDQFDQTPTHDPYNDRPSGLIDHDSDDLERDFTDTLPDGGGDD